jgi:hypothetical protein
MTMSDNPAHVPKTPPRPTLQKLQPPTPIVAKNATSQPFTSTHAERDENITNMWYEISRKIIGPMPADRFFDAFLPAATSPAPEFNKRELDKMMKVTSETQMYKSFVSYRCNLSLFHCH